VLAGPAPGARRDRLLGLPAPALVGERAGGKLSGRPANRVGSPGRPRARGLPRPPPPPRLAGPGRRGTCRWIAVPRHPRPNLTGRMVAPGHHRLHHLRATGWSARPQCPACGDPESVRRTRKKISREKGGGRDVSRRLEHHVSRYLGAVTRLAPLEAGDKRRPRHTYRAGQQLRRRPAPGDAARQTCAGQSGGQGPHRHPGEDEARLGEAIERYGRGSGRGDRPETPPRPLRPTLGPRPGGSGLGELLGFSDRQYARARRDETPATATSTTSPRPAGDDLELDWTAGESLTRGTGRLLPSVFLLVRPTRRLAPGRVHRRLPTASAAGVTRTARRPPGPSCELVERGTRWRSGGSTGRGMPGVRPSAALRRPVVRVGPAPTTPRPCSAATLWALDLTADLGVANPSPRWSART